MKSLLNALSFIFVLGTVIISTQSCNGAKTSDGTDQQIADNKSNETTDIKAYYFHATRRCATCQAVESVTQEALKEYYGEKVAFQTINRDENKDNPMIEKYKISGQTLLIIKGDKVVNLTTDAFMNARTSPDKFKAKLKTTIDSMM